MSRTREELDEGDPWRGVLAALDALREALYDWRDDVERMTGAALVDAGRAREAVVLVEDRLAAFDLAEAVAVRDEMRSTLELIRSGELP